MERREPLHPSRTPPYSHSRFVGRSDFPYGYSREYRKVNREPEDYPRTYGRDHLSYRELDFRRDQPHYKDVDIRRDPYKDMDLRRDFAPHKDMNMRREQPHYKEMDYRDRERDYYRYRDHEPYYNSESYSSSHNGDSRRDFYRSSVGPSRVYKEESYDSYGGGHYSWRDEPLRKEEPKPPPSLPTHPPKPIKMPKNDYSQHFVDTRQRPQNFIRDANLEDRFEEYPKLRELTRLKDDLIRSQATPPLYLQADLKTFDASRLGSKFDVILIDPPWEEYSRRYPAAGIPFWTFEEMAALPIGALAASPSFVWLWCGTEEGLDQGRLLLKRWGFRRCEDICWVKSNLQPSNELPATVRSESKCIFHHTKEHVLMGIKGTVRRNQDGHLIHANIDTDVIISEESPSGQKPRELYHIIEHFSQGRRRLELFGLDHNIRPGWVTVGIDISHSNFSAEKYRSFFVDANGKDNHLLSSTAGTLPLSRLRVRN